MFLCSQVALGDVLSLCSQFSAFLTSHSDFALGLQVTRAVHSVCRPSWRTQLHVAHLLSSSFQSPPAAMSSCFLQNSTFSPLFHTECFCYCFFFSPFLQTTLEAFFVPDLLNLEQYSSWICQRTTPIFDRFFVSHCRMINFAVLVQACAWSQ